MRLIFMGTPDFAVPTLKALATSHDVLAVYCQPPRPAGRGHQLQACPVQRTAEDMGLRTHHPVSLRDPDEQKRFAGYAADIAIVVAYGLILPKAILHAPRLGCLNVHASLLPRWRGAAPIHRAIIAGDDETGVCIMRMEAGLDTGPVLLREVVPIGREDTAGDLHDRLAELGARLCVAALDGLGTMSASPQPDSGVTYAQKIDKSEAAIEWTRPAVEIDRLIRGLSPFPGAWCPVAGERLKILRSRHIDGSGRPGEVIEAGPERLVVATSCGAVEVLEAQRGGRRPMPAMELLRGLPLRTGDLIG
ncbi:MAG: methionyl-tRNA formyltransferase [Alkalilacustris sp.]